MTSDLRKKVSNLGFQFLVQTRGLLHIYYIYIFSRVSYIMLSKYYELVISVPVQVLHCYVWIYIFIHVAVCIKSHFPYLNGTNSFKLS